MLDLIRKKQKTMIIKVVFWGIIATFVGTIFLVWGKGSDDTGRGGSGGVAATVNDAVISNQAYQTYYNNRYSQLQSLYGSNIPEALLSQLNLEEQSLNDLIENELLRQEADRRNIKVSQQEVVDSIAAIPYFQDNGSFSKSRYIQILQAQRMSADQFEEQQRDSLRIDKLSQQLQDGIEITPADIEDEFRRRNEKVRLEVLRFEPGNFEKKVETSDSALEDFYTQRRESYRVDDRISLAYLTFNASDFVDAAEVSQADLEKYYRRNRGAFEVAEEVRAAHILIKLAQDADSEKRAAKRAEIDAILEKARAGEDFAALAKRYSEDSSKSSGGDLGFFPRGRMVKPFENAAFSLPVGEVSDVVTSQFGYHIIKVLDRKEPRVKSLEEVIDEVTAGAKKEQAYQLAYEKALDAYNLNRKGGGIEKAAADLGLALEETPLFGRGELVPAFAAHPEIISTAFTLAQGEMARPVRSGEVTYLVGLKEKKTSYIPELSEVRQQVEQAYRYEQARVLAEQSAKDALVALEEGKSLKQAARQTGGLQRTSEEFARANTDIIPGLGTSEELAAQAFKLSVEAPLAPGVYSIGESFVVATLKDRTPADMSQLDDARREELRTALLEQRKSEQLDNTIKTLKEQAEIVINIQFNRG